jgi:isoleucyl-tRNA synthetase
MGQALKKQFDKKFKQKLAELTSAQLREYLLTGNLEVNGIKIEEGWLKVVKNFNSKYVDDQKYGCACSSMSSVIIDTTMDEELLNMGQSREITNRI